MRSLHKFRFQVCVTLLAAGLVFAGGCQSIPDDIASFTTPYQVPANSETYILHPPDGVEIFCAKIPEINLQVQSIRPDGKITLEGLGELEVAGKTLAQVSQLIREKASKLYALQGDYPYRCTCQSDAEQSLLCAG